MPSQFRIPGHRAGYTPKITLNYKRRGRIMPGRIAPCSQEDLSPKIPYPQAILPSPPPGEHAFILNPKP
eukprot:3099279-Rhodomonas_salina.1